MAMRHNGLVYGQHEPALHGLLGKKVVLRIDPADVSVVSVWTLEDKFICRAAANLRLPFMADAQSLRAAIKAKSKHRRTVREFHEQRPRLYAMDVPELLLPRAARNG